MILYFDTSALLKKYFKEPGSAEVVSEFKKGADIITSTVTYAETMATIHRKKREIRGEEQLFGRIIDTFQRDWDSFICVEVTNELNVLIDRLVSSHPLRGFDAIHLASAISVNERLPVGLLFACFDSKLAHAAKKENLETFPPNI